ncbi:MAG: efflux RND transporter periplasmic adaptor subunit [Gammaproteobacteria bacterium]|nr:efflux RND transporter periplasmic adaptor subunit [Gammaproteobacteria bacterium]
MIISKKTNHFLLFCCGLTISLFLPACNNDNSSGTGIPRAESVVHRVETIPVERKSVSLKQIVSGTLEAVTEIRLYNEESGRITKLPYHEGDQVKQGRLLAQLDNKLLQTDLDKATATQEQAKLDLSRLIKLLPKQISTEDEVARARTQLDLAIAEENRQRIRLQRTSINAPIDGLITERLYEPGDMLAPQSHILSIIDPGALRLKTSLAERWLPLVKMDQTVDLHIDALGDRKIAAHITRIHPTVNASTHKGIIEILIDPVPDGAAVGQFARADIELKATDRLVIPVHTIHYEPEGTYVFRVIEDNNKNHIAEKVHFEQGQQFNDFAEVLSGLNVGDNIVSRGYLGLRDGKKVYLINFEKTRPETDTSINSATNNTNQPR